MTREIIWIYWKPAWREKKLVQVSDQKCIKLPANRALSASDFWMMGCAKVNVCRTDSLGLSGAMPASIFDTDYRAEIIHLYNFLEANICMGQTRFVYMNFSSYEHVSSVLKLYICRHAYGSRMHTVVSAVWWYRIRSKGVYLTLLAGAQKTMTIKNHPLNQDKICTVQTENTRYLKMRRNIKIKPFKIPASNIKNGKLALGNRDQSRALSSKEVKIQLISNTGQPLLLKSFPIATLLSKRVVAMQEMPVKAAFKWQTERTKQTEIREEAGRHERKVVRLRWSA